MGRWAYRILPLGLLGVLSVVTLNAAHADVAPAGMASLLQELSELHGQYKVDGRMMDGSVCKLSVQARANEFTVVLTDHRPEQILVSMELRPQQRLAFFDLRNNPEVRTELRIRDRIRYVGAPVREVDLSLYMEEQDEGRKVLVIFEDHIRRRRYTCRGDKHQTMPDKLKFYSPWTSGH